MLLLSLMHMCPVPLRLRASGHTAHLVRTDKGTWAAVGLDGWAPWLWDWDVGSLVYFSIELAHMHMIPMRPVLVDC